MSAPACLCAAREGEAHLPGCPIAACDCRRAHVGGHRLPPPSGPPGLYRHGLHCASLRVTVDVEHVAEKLAKVDDLLAKNAEVRLYTRKLRLSIIHHERPVVPKPLTEREP